LRKSKPIPSISDSFSQERKVSIFRSLFRGRTDIFANRWQNQQGRSGYSVACNNEWIKGVCNKPRIKCQDCSHRQFSELNDQVIYRHLAGKQVVGQLLPCGNFTALHFQICITCVGGNRTGYLSSLHATEVMTLKLCGVELGDIH